MKRTSKDPNSFSAIYQSGLMDFDTFKTIIWLLMLPHTLRIEAAKRDKRFNKYLEKTNEFNKLFDEGRYEEAQQVLDKK